jgi:hypothetical protein
MTEPESRYRPLAATMEAWRMFWFRPLPANTLGLVRMAFGVVAIGWHNRLAAVGVFVLILSFEHRDPWVWNSGDITVRIEALFLALSPSGAALSFDQARSTGTFWSAQLRPQWPLRLMQLQLSLIYLASALIKMNGSTWPQGTAVSYAPRPQDLALLPTPHWLTNSALLVNAVTWGTPAVELALAILVWNRRLRPWVLAAGVVMHTMIMITIAVGFSPWLCSCCTWRSFRPKPCNDFHAAPNTWRRSL